MALVRVTFEDGNSITTRINATFEEAKVYYLGQTFNLGVVDDDMQKCTAIEEVPS